VLQQYCDDVRNSNATGKNGHRKEKEIKGMQEQKAIRKEGTENEKKKEGKGGKEKLS
jgi:hypothetical protein